MRLLERVLNVVLPPSAALSLVFLWPLLAILKAFRWLLSWFVHENVRGKVILITGSSSGIGEHMAYEYARKGARLVLVARREDQLRAVADRAITKGASDVHVLVGDMTKEDDCRSVVAATIDKYGRLDHLINNAGNINSYFFEDAQDTKALTTVVDTDFWGPIYMTYFALPHLRRTHGKILVTASVGSYMPLPRESIYNGAKAGILQFFDTLRVEVGDTIGITILMPGFTESEGTQGKMINENGEMIFNQKKRDEQFGPSPMAFTEEVAKAAVKGMIRGQRYVVVPFYYSVFLLYRVFAPEVVEWMLRFGFVSHPNKPRSKQALEATNAQKIASYNNAVSESVPCCSLVDLFLPLYSYLSEACIDLTKLKLNGTITPMIDDLVHLSFMNLSESSLWGLIPSKLIRCQSLSILDLNHNSLDGELL